MIYNYQYFFGDIFISGLSNSDILKNLTVKGKLSGKRKRENKKKNLNKLTRKERQ